MPHYIPAADLSDAQIDEIAIHGTADVGGTVFGEWRRDANGETWLRSLSSIEAAAAAMEPFDYGDDDDFEGDGDE